MGFLNPYDKQQQRVLTFLIYHGDGAKLAFDLVVSFTDVSRHLVDGIELSLAHGTHQEEHPTSVIVYAVNFHEGALVRDEQTLRADEDILQGHGTHGKGGFVAALTSGGVYS